MTVPEQIDMQEVLTQLNGLAGSLHRKDWSSAGRFCLPTIRASGLEPEVLEGPERVLAGYRQRLEDVEPSETIDGSVEVDVFGDTATASTVMQAQHRGLAFGARSILVGFSYRDVLARTPEGWRLEHREVVAAWTTLDATLMLAQGLHL